MSDDFFTAYGRASKATEDPILASGRHPFQQAEMAAVVEDVTAKLDLEPDHDLLEIGCSVGLLLRPLAKRVRRVVGIDHSSCIER